MFALSLIIMSLNNGLKVFPCKAQHLCHISIGIYYCLFLRKILGFLLIHVPSHFYYNVRVFTFMPRDSELCLTPLLGLFFI